MRVQTVTGIDDDRKMRETFTDFHRVGRGARCFMTHDDRVRRQRRHRQQRIAEAFALGHWTGAFIDVNDIRPEVLPCELKGTARACRIFGKHIDNRFAS